MTQDRTAGRIAAAALVIVPILYFRFDGVQEFHLTKVFLANLFALATWGAVLLSRDKEQGRIFVPSFVGLTVMALAVWMFASVAWSDVPERGYESVITSIGPLALYLFWLSRGETAQKLASWACAAGAVVAGVGLLQWTGILQVNFDAYGKVDAGSTLGLTNFSAEFLMPWIAVPFVLAVRAGTPRIRWAFAAAGALPLLYILVTGSRASQLGLVVGSLVGLAVYARRHSVRVVLTLVALAGVLSVGAWGVKAVDDGAVQMRLVSWKQTLAMVADQPLLGVGFGNFTVNYPGYPDRWLDEAKSRLNLIIDHPHNTPLEIISEGGAVSGLLLLVLTFGIAMLVRRHARADRLLASAFASGLVAFGVAAVFGFPQTLAAPMLAFFALLAALELPPESAPIRIPERGMALVLGALGLWATLGTASLAFAEITFQLAKREVNREERTGLLETALVANPTHLEALISRSNEALAQGLPEDAVRYLQRAADVAPADARVLRQLGILFAQAGEFDTALAYMRRAYELNISQDSVYAPLITALLVELRDLEGAEKFASGVLEHWQFPEVFSALIDVQLRREKTADARASFDKGFALYPDDLQLGLLHPRLLFAEGDLQGAGAAVRHLRPARLSVVQSGQLDVIEAKLALRENRSAALEKIDAMITRNPVTRKLMQADAELRDLVK